MASHSTLKPAEFPSGTSPSLVRATTVGWPPGQAEQFVKSIPDVSAKPSPTPVSASKSSLALTAGFTPPTPATAAGAGIAEIIPVSAMSNIATGEIASESSRVRLLDMEGILDVDL